MDRIPPNSYEAEVAVLSACLLDNSALDEAAGILTSSDFYLQSHRVLFSGMLEIRDASKPIDMIVLTDHLQTSERLEAVGGPSAISNLAGRISTAANVSYWAGIVAAKARLREVITTGYQAATDAFDEPADVDRFLGEVEGKFLAINQARSGNTSLDARALAHGAFSRIEALAKRSGEMTGLASGYADLDKLTCGFQPGDLVILAARPSVGKTALALNIAVRSSRLGRGRVMFFSLEMMADAVGLRMMSTESRVPHQRLRQGEIYQRDWVQLAEAANKITQSDLAIDDSSDLTIGQLRARARRENHQRPLALVVVDYLQLLHGSEKRKDGSREQEIAEISRGLKALGKELRVPVLALAQLNRKAEESNEPPRLSHLRESGAIEQDADTIMFLHRPPVGDNEHHEGHLAAAQTDGDYLDLIVAKHRNGPTDSLRLLFFKDTVRFETFAGAYDYTAMPGAGAVQ